MQKKEKNKSIITNKSKREDEYGKRIIPYIIKRFN